MGVIATLGRWAWRLYATDGVPSSGAQEPQKPDIIAFVDAVDARLRNDVFTEVTSGTTTNMALAAFAETKVLSINKASGAAHAVALPAPGAAGRRIQVIDGKGDAGANNITINGTLVGGTSTVIATNGGWVRLLDTGTAWLIDG